MEEKARRDAFNMKVLKRQDPHIVDIVGSATFVVLYELDGEWTKLGIEGPMFLYRRSCAPKYGFSVLNRNGIENFAANITGEDDLERTEEFVIYRAHSDEQVLGIWIYDAQERISIGETMSRLHSDTFAGPSTSQSVPPPSAQTGQSISLDALFGKPTPSNSAGQPRPPALSGTDLLDSMFKSAATAPSQVLHNNGLASQPQQALTSRAPDSGSADLKALLGLTGGSLSNGADGAKADIRHTTPNTQQLPHGLESLFASTRIDNNSSATAPSNIPPQNSISTSFADAASTSLNDALRIRQLSTGALDRRDFVREVLSLIHTDKDFVDSLYQNYLSRVQ